MENVIFKMIDREAWEAWASNRFCPFLRGPCRPDCAMLCKGVNLGADEFACVIEEGMYSTWITR